MDPCPFVRLLVESLALKLPAISKPASGSGVHPSTTPCFCVLQLQDCSNSSPQTTPLPLASSYTSGPCVTAASSEISPSPPVVFSVDSAALQRLSNKPATLSAAVHVGRTGSTCGFSAGRLLGKVRVSVDLVPANERSVVAFSGWVAVGGGARLHLVVRAEPDPRFVFQFGGEPECSPVVYQIQGGVRQPVFSCRFSAERRRTTRSRSMPTDHSSTSSMIKSWLSSLSGNGDRSRSKSKERKGWMVTIHDLCGSPVAAASMVTPFVPSPGSDRVSRSNPGAWLILRPTGVSSSSWKPWGRLEAWRERSPIDALGYRFELVADDLPGSSIGPIAESSISARKGGQFLIDPSAAGEAVSRSWPSVGGFVMASTVEGEGKLSKPTVQVGVQHVSCMADVALFVALAAAVDLSVDACQLFSHKLRKELCQVPQDYIS